MVNYQEILDAIYEKLQKRVDKGTVASYIPELADVPKEKFGIYLNRINGDDYFVGDWEEPFSIQSISKVLSFALAFSKLKNQVFRRLDVEPSGNPFNHLSLLEMENGIPRNPFINSGAIVIADMLISLLDDPKNDFLAFLQ